MPDPAREHLLPCILTRPTSCLDTLLPRTPGLDRPNQIRAGAGIGQGDDIAMSPARSSALVEPEPAAWSRSDTEYALHTAFRLPIAWLAGERHWARLVLGMPRATRNLTARTLKPRLASTLGRSPGDPELGMLVAACVAARTVRQLQFLRCHRPGGWSPSIRLQGREHLDAALSAGRGVILWVTPTAYASLITKMTLHLEDLAPHHLSRWYHGASRSRWGVRLLNPIQRRAEDLYLAERVSIGEHQSPLRALRQLRRLLGENHDRVHHRWQGERRGHLRPFPAGFHDLGAGTDQARRRHRRAAPAGSDFSRSGRRVHDDDRAAAARFNRCCTSNRAGAEDPGRAARASGALPPGTVLLAGRPCLRPWRSTGCSRGCAIANGGGHDTTTRVRYDDLSSGCRALKSCSTPIRRHRRRRRPLGAAYRGVRLAGS